MKAQTTFPHDTDFMLTRECNQMTHSEHEAVCTTVPYQRPNYCGH